MKIEQHTGFPRKTDVSVEGIEWQPKFQPAVSSHLSLIATSLLYELKKANIKWKRSVAALSKRMFSNWLDRQHRQVEQISHSRECSLMIELGVQLSSITLCIGMDPSIRSVPCRLCSDRGKNLLDLDESLLLRIAQFMDGRSVLNFCQVCSELRSVVLSNIASLRRLKSALYDVFIAFNKHTGREDVLALKCGRSTGSPSFGAASIEEVVPPALRCRLRIHFGTNVLVSNWLPDIYRLYTENRLYPVAFVFSGGSFNGEVRRCRFVGADLRCFVESDFIAFIRLFTPHLKEVQLATSKLFEIRCSTLFLLSMLGLVSVFGMVYEPAPVFSTEDICRMLCLWRYSSRSHSCEAYIRRPPDWGDVNWLQYGSIQTIGEVVSTVKVRHALSDDVVLTLNFH